MRAAVARGARYTAVGVFCAGVHNVIMIAGTALGGSLLACLAVSFAVVVVTGYLLHAFFTFGQPRSWRAFARYTLAMAAAVPVTYALLFVLAELMRLPMFVASPVVTLLMFAANFLVSRWAVHSKRPETAA